MHEVSMCQAIARTALVHAGDRPVTRVCVRIGHFRQVVPEALTFAWDAVTSGSELDGARLAVEYVEASVACDVCAAVTTLDTPVLVCGSCGSRAVHLRTGEELDVVGLDVRVTGEEVADGPVPSSRRRD